MIKFSAQHSIKLHTLFTSIFIVILTSIVLIGCSGTPSASGVSAMAMGSASPEINTPNANNQMLKLSALKGSYVLIEFWESNNLESRTNHFEMERLYNKYKDENFKNGKKYCVYSVSLDTDKDKWMAAIAADNITWDCQTIDTKGWNATAALDFGINYLPKYYLIDGDGVVVKKNILIKDLEQILDSNLN
jgi:hypothetical protein